MKNFTFISLFVLLMLSASVSWAADKTITLSVPDMNCPSCPYMVEKSISVVEGVKSATAELQNRTCSVTFDDAIASVDDILGATANIGYQSSVIESENDS